MQFNLLGCGFLFLFAIVLAPFSLLRHFMPNGDFYGAIIGSIVAIPLITILDLRLRLNSRTDEEIESSNVDCLIDYRRGGMLGCLPVWLLVWGFPVVLYNGFSERFNAAPTPAPTAMVSATPSLSSGEYYLNLAEKAHASKDHKAVLNWTELAAREKLTPDGNLRVLSLTAGAHEALKQYDKACKAYKQCLNLAPKNREYKASLDRCRKAQQQKRT